MSVYQMREDLRKLIDLVVNVRCPNGTRKRSPRFPKTLHGPPPPQPGPPSCGLQGGSRSERGRVVAEKLLSSVRQLGNIAPLSRKWVFRGSGIVLGLAILAATTRGAYGRFSLQLSLSAGPGFLPGLFLISTQLLVAVRCLSQYLEVAGPLRCGRFPNLTPFLERVLTMKNSSPNSWFHRFSRTWLKGGRQRRPAASRSCTRPWLERLEDRTLPSVTIASTNNNGNGYTALDFNQSGGYTPPDTNGAAGPGGYVETVNQTIALYGNKSTGTPATTAALTTFWFTTGGLAHADLGSSLSDPVVTYNDQIGRFVVADQDVDFNTHVSRFDIAVSKASNPGTLGTADWTFYQVNTTQSHEDADYPGNFGYNHDALVFTLNMFAVAGTTGTNHVQVISINNTDLANNVSQSSLHIYQNNLNDFAIRPTTMHSSVAGDPMWLVTEHGDNTTIDVIKMTGVLSTSAAFAYTHLTVTPYSPVVNPLNPNGTVITTNIDSRIQKASEWNNTLVAAHAVSVSSTQDVIQWYKFDVSSGTPTLADQGRVSGGANTYLTYPAIDINSSGQIGLTYMKSGTDASTDYMSMDVTGRSTSDAAGTMEASVLVPAGTGKANYSDFASGGRAGDLSGINVDPSDGSFWAANEFANTEATANWGTAVANFTLSNPLPSTDMAVTASGPSSVTAGTNATYTITITNNGPNAAQGVVLSDTLPAGSVFVSMTQTTGADTFTLSQSGGAATETANANIASGSSDTFSLVVSAPASLANGAAFNNTSSVSAQNPDTNTANDSVTVTGSVVNTSPNADLAVSISGPASGNEGDTVTYNITVTNAGPSSASSTTLTDTLPSILNFKSATASQGTFTVSGGVVTFSLGTIAANGTVTASVTAQAVEDGSASNTVSVSSSSPDPNTVNNNASATTSFAEPGISVSGAIRTRSKTLTNFQVATFTHANAVEPTSAFSATINWGDGTTSAGAITLSGTTYAVTGSHTYSSGSRHTISTTVTETGNSPVGEGGNKVDVNPGTLPLDQRDVVRLADLSGDSPSTGGEDSSLTASFPAPALVNIPDPATGGRTSFGGQVLPAALNVDPHLVAALLDSSLRSPYTTALLAAPSIPSLIAQPLPASLIPNETVSRKAWDQSPPNRPGQELIFASYNSSEETDDVSAGNASEPVTDPDLLDSYYY